MLFPFVKNITEIISFKTFMLLSSWVITAQQLQAQPEKNSVQHFKGLFLSLGIRARKIFHFCQKTTSLFLIITPTTKK